MRNLLMLLSAVLTASLLLSAAAGCDSSNQSPESAVLRNRTDGPMLYWGVHESFEGGAIRTLEIDPTDPPYDLVAAGDTAVLGPCTLPGPYADQKLRLWDVMPAEDGTTAKAIQAVGWSDGEPLYGLVNALHENDCRVVVDSLPSLLDSPQSSQRP